MAISRSGYKVKSNPKEDSALLHRESCATCPRAWYAVRVLRNSLHFLCFPCWVKEYLSDNPNYRVQEPSNEPS